MKIKEFFVNIEKKNIARILFPVVVSVLVATMAITLSNGVNEEEEAAPILVTEAPEEVVEVVATTEPTTEPPRDLYVILSAETTQNDLRIRFYNRMFFLYMGVNFEVQVTPDGGEPKTYVDEEGDGRIDIKNVKAGQYKIELVLPDGYECPKSKLFITVKDKVAYKPLANIKDDIKKETEIDTSKEETKEKDTVQEVVLKDTVELVKSTETKHVDYILVAFNDVRNPLWIPTESTTSVDVTGETAESTTGTSEPESTSPSEGPDEEPGTTSPEDSTTEPATRPEPPTTNPDDPLRDREGNELYLKNGSEYVAAKTPDYKEGNTFYKKVVTYTYTGWQKLDGSTYYFDKNGKPVTGEQIIGGAKYIFTKTGELKSGSGTLGIDVSKYQGDIDWKAVKASGVQFVIIRCAYRGYGTGVLVEDVNFKRNLAGAKAAGLDIGIYIFSQAINEVEAVEEASACLNYLNGMKIKYPIFIDIETSGGNGSGRADGLTVTQRTNVAIAFCETIKNAGYKPGVYANKNYLTNKMDASKLNKYYIWLAQYAEKPTYAGEYDMWQYTSKGKVAGISGNVDMNLSYIF